MLYPCAGIRKSKAVDKDSEFSDRQNPSFSPIQYSSHKQFPRTRSNARPRNPTSSIGLLKGVDSCVMSPPLGLSRLTYTLRLFRFVSSLWRYRKCLHQQSTTTKMHFSTSVVSPSSHALCLVVYHAVAGSRGPDPSATMYMKTVGSITGH